MTKSLCSRGQILGDGERSDGWDGARPDGGGQRNGRQRLIMADNGRQWPIVADSGR